MKTAWIGFAIVLADVIVFGAIAYWVIDLFR